MAQRPVTLADIVRRHVSLEIEGFDRLYFNGWVPALQTSGQIAGWLHWRGFLIASPAALGRNSQAFRAAVRRYADGNQIPWVLFRKGDRKLDVIRPYLEAAERAGQSTVAGDDDDRDALNVSSLHEREIAERRGGACGADHQLLHPVCVRPHLLDARLRAP